MQKLGPLVTIEYGELTFGSLAKAKKLHDRILHEIPHAKVILFPGRDEAFEVTVDGKFIYSKLQLRAYPPTRQILHIIMNEAYGIPAYYEKPPFERKRICKILI